MNIYLLLYLHVCVYVCICGIVYVFVPTGCEQAKAETMAKITKPLSLYRLLVNAVRFGKSVCESQCG